MDKVQNHPEYPLAKQLMETMVTNSQRPFQGNVNFAEEVFRVIAEQRADGIATTYQSDPEHMDRKNLIVDVGEGDQILVATSHSDVVGVEDQPWETDPWVLTEKDDQWLGRGTCDTHGTGVAMLLAVLRDDVREEFKNAGVRMSILFTYDEEATTPEFSMRGARCAAGLLGNESIIQAKNFIVGEPTEVDGVITPMRGHKGRFLAKFTVNAPEAGHVSNTEQNALMEACRIVHEMERYGKVMTYGSSKDGEAQIFNPPYSTVQVSSGEIKSGDYSTAPSTASFTVDMRTLPFAHQFRVDGIIDLINKHHMHHGETVAVEILKNGEGSLTSARSPMVILAEGVTERSARGFNGGNEGRIFRNHAGMEGITIGPGELEYAHMPNERIRIAAVLQGADIYAQLFKRSIELHQK